MALVCLAAMHGERSNTAKLSAISIIQNLYIQLVIIVVTFNISVIGKTNLTKRLQNDFQIGLRVIGL